MSYLINSRAKRPWLVKIMLLHATFATLLAWAPRYEGKSLFPVKHFRIALALHRGPRATPRPKGQTRRPTHVVNIGEKRRRRLLLRPNRAKSAEMGFGPLAKA